MEESKETPQGQAATNPPEASLKRVKIRVKERIPRHSRRRRKMATLTKLIMLVCATLAGFVVGGKLSAKFHRPEGPILHFRGGSEPDPIGRSDKATFTAQTATKPSTHLKP